MRENRLAKLAGLRGIVKTAANSYQARINNAETSSDLDLIQREIEADRGLGGMEKHTLIGSIGPKKESIRIYEARRADIASQTSPAAIAATKAKLYPTPTSMESKQSYIQRAKEGGSTSSDNDLAEYYDASVGSQEPLSPAQPAVKPKAPSGSPQRTRGPSDATAVIKDDLWGKTASDSNYKYIISIDGKSFQWAGAEKSGVHKQGDKNWSVMVGRINQLTGVDRVTPTAATPAPAVTAPAVPAEAPAATTGLDQALVQKVAAVLNKALSYELNRQSVQSEQDEIRSLKNTLGGLNGLAAIIVSRVGDVLTTLSAASLAEINAGTRKELAVNMKGKFAGDVGTILRQVSEITRMGNKSPGSIRRLKSSLTQTPAAPATATPPAATTPATPAPAADDGHSKDASLNKKFIKAATLRRLKIRSQMEAAIDSSAQMGRARVS